jgi:hypothetical protein
MPFVNGRWLETNPGSATQPPPPGYNNPWFDLQGQAQQAQGGSFQPTPSNPEQEGTPGFNPHMVGPWYGSGGNGGGMDYTNPPYNPDRFGGGGGGFGSYNPQGIGATIMPVDPMGQGAGNLDRFGGGGGLTRPGSGSVNVNGQQIGLYPATPQMQTPTPVPMPGATATMVNPDAAYPKFDPAFLTQIQGALESPNGPYAGRAVGDYAPNTAPPNVQNPQTDQDWKDRFYWFAAHPEALSSPSAPRAAAAPSVPWQQFAKDVYSDVNANRSFNELSGVVDDARLQQAQAQFGWQLGPSGLASNDAAIAQATAMKQAHPEFSYQVYQRPDGSFGIAARELDQQAQVARGYTPAGMQQPHPVSSTYSGGGGGGSKSTYKGSSYKSSGGGYTTPKPVAAPAAPPQGKTTIQPGPALDTRMVGGSVNMNQPVEGQIIRLQRSDGPVP